MTFYVVKSNSDKINVKAKKCFKSDNLTTAYAKYCIDVKNKEAKNIYLIVDFENRKSTLFDRIQFNDRKNPLLPYFIIANYNQNLNYKYPERTIRDDNTKIIFNGGFIREFNDNFAAIREYITKISENNYDVEFCISYKMLFDEPKDDTIYTRTIDNSSMNFCEKSYKTKRFKFVDDLFSWGSEI